MKLMIVEFIGVFIVTMGVLSLVPGRGFSRRRRLAESTVVAAFTATCWALLLGMLEVVFA